MEKIINNITAYIWLALTVACFIGVIITGAWWHLFTTAISVLMFLALRRDDENEDDE